MPRLFIALEIPPDIVQTLASMRGGLHGARWLDPENYHLTLCFIGDIDPVRAEELDLQLGHLRGNPLKVTVQQLSSLGERKPHSVIAEIASTCPLRELRNELKRIVHRARIRLERRKYIPHVTLARFKDVSSVELADYLTIRGYFPPLSFTATRVALFSARPLTGGGPYVIERTYELTGKSQQH